MTRVIDVLGIVVRPVSRTVVGIVATHVGGPVPGHGRAVAVEAV